jgi:predicted membrane channel-forming protein YqfA (hemolysin III family)
MSTWIELYGTIMAFVYPLVNATVLVACIYAGRNRAWRREFVCLGAAAFLSLVCSGIMLVVRLANSGELAVSAASRRSLLVPHDVCEIVSIVLYCVGFIMLAHHIGSSASATREV